METAPKFFIYARKSSEDSQRQVASINDQINALKLVAEREGLNVVRKPFTEERSAKDPGRPVFDDLLNLIKFGEANALLCWDIDRLSRNPIDNGRLQWMLQKSVIKMIKTPGRTYYPEDAGLLMSIEGGRATDYVMRLSKNVKRGLNSKAAKGWRPGPAPIGYKSVGEEGNKYILPDTERFALVRQIWDLYLSGTYLVSELRELANNKWGLRTYPRRRTGGRPLAMSHMYKVLTNPFYYGEFEWEDQETGERRFFVGKHQPMITKREFMRAQVLLGKKGKQQPQTREFAFTGLMKCGECDSAITAEEKHQLICAGCKFKFGYEGKTACPSCKKSIDKMRNPTIRHYTYYHCTKKKNRSCSQGSIQLKDLEEQFNKILGDITIDDDYLKVALDYLAEKRKHEGGKETTIRQSLQSAYNDCQTRLKNLEREYTSANNSTYDLYTPEDFKESKKNILAERKIIEEELANVQDNFDRSIDETERVANFCHMAQKEFNTDDLKKKRSIFSTIGSKLTLKDKKLFIDRLHPYMLIENELRAQRELYDALEPGKRGYEQRRKAIFDASIPSWLGDRESNPN